MRSTLNKSAWDRARGLLFVIIVLILFTFTALNILSGPGKPGLLGLRGYTVLSDSMKPTLQAGDYVLIHTEPYSDLDEGQIVTYLLGDDTFITHRLTEESNGEWLVQGDQNSHLDETAVTSQNYVGAHLFTVPKIGGWLVNIKNPLVIGTICLLIAVYLIFMFFRSSRNPEKDA